jgi:formylglycine-generating enzyme required for sulfatase activity
MKKLLLRIAVLLSILTGCRLFQPGAGEVRFSEIDGMEMIFVPAGEFEMGSATADPHADEDEFPLHLVYVEAFWVDRTEVTNAMYVSCIEAGVCTPPARSDFYLESAYAYHPVTGISWDQAAAYCSWAGRRLPSEAEWEKTARGTDGRIYPWGNSIPTDELANFDQHVDETTPVGSYPDGASPYGALDMAGNAWEWVLDGYSPEYYSISPEQNPISDSPINRRVLRGGNWDSNAEGVRSANRFWAFPGRNDTDGFRCAKSH